MDVWAGRLFFEGLWSLRWELPIRHHAYTSTRNHAHTQMKEPIDIDEARADDPESLRDALVDQFGHLVDEVTALSTVVDGLPDEVLEGRPEPGALTMKELYGALATLDTEVRRVRVNRVVEEDAPTLDPVDIEAEVRESGWNEHDIGAILDRVTEARRELTDQLEALSLDAWHRPATLEGETIRLFELVYRMTQDDIERLRTLGYRLHGAHLSDRDEPLPT